MQEASCRRFDIQKRVEPNENPVKLRTKKKTQVADAEGSELSMYGAQATKLPPGLEQPLSCSKVNIGMARMHASRKASKLTN